MLRAQTKKDLVSLGDNPLLSVGGRRWGINHRAVPYAIVGIILAVVGVAIFWRSGYIAGGDVWPLTFVPGNNAWQQNWPIWGPTVTGIGSPQYNPTMLVWSLFAGLVSLFHLTGPHQQDVFLAVLLVGEGMGTTHLVRALYPKRPLMAIIVGLAVPLSLYNAIAFLNPIQAFAIGWFPFSAGVIVNSRAFPWYLKSVRLGLLTLGLWVLAGTPPMAVIWVIWVAIWLAFSFRRQWSHIGRTVIGSVVLAILLNAWWAYAAAITLDGGSIAQTFSGPLAWAWVNQHASLLNLLSMQGQWSWPQKVYYPWSVTYHHGILPWLLFAPFLLALISAFWMQRERNRWMWIGWGGVSLWIGQGTHPPFGWINTWLYMHAPLFWLFRDPQVEMDILLLVSLMMLAGLVIDEFYKNLKNFGRFKARSGISVVFVTIAAATLMSNGYGLITGHAFPHHVAASTPSSNVHVPTYWSWAARFLNSPSHAGGRILALPNDDFYQMPYRWGFYGTDSIAQSYFHAPVVLLNPNPSGYLAGTASYQETLSRLYTAIASHPEEHIAPMLRSMGIHWIVERGDINWQVRGRNILPAPYIKWYLAHQPGIQKVRTFGALTVYRVQSYQHVVSVASQADVWSGNAVPPLAIPKTLTSRIAHGNVAWLFRKAPHLPVGQRVQELPTLDVPHYLPVTHSGYLYLRPTTVAVQARWRRDHLTVRLVGFPIRQGSRIIRWTRSEDIPLSSPLPAIVGVQVGGSNFTWSSQSRAFRGGHFVTVGSYTLPTENGSTTIKLLRGHNIPLATSWSAVGNCNAYAALPASQTQLWERALTGGGIELHAGTQAACSEKVSQEAAGPGILSVSVQSKHVEGKPPAVALLEGRRVIMHTVLGMSSTWSVWSGYTDSALRRRLSVFTYSFASPGHPTINDYRVALTQFHVGAQRTISLTGSTFPVSAGKIIQDNAPLGRNLVPKRFVGGELWTPIFNSNAYRKESLVRAGIKGFVHNGVLTLQARSDGAGEAETISGVGGHVVTIRVDARTVHGNPAAVSIVNLSTGKVLWNTSLPAGVSGWHNLSTVLTLPQSDGAIGIDFYAYGGGGTSTVTQYRNPSIKMWAPGVQTAWLISGNGKSLFAGPLKESGNGSTYHVTLNHGDRLLILHTSYSPLWAIRWRGSRQAWMHVRVDGIYNGWVIPASVGNRRAQVILAFRPYRWYAFLWWAGIISAIASMLYLLLQRVRTSGRGAQKGVSL